MTDTPQEAERLARVDASLAKQLQASIERNARMKTALHILCDDPSTSRATAASIARILRDTAS
jgi:hypothetical protein